MINHIEILNFATIEHISFDLGDRLNIITGETGAGKSVLVTAISMVLGDRADSSMVRTGQDRATITIVGERDGEEVIISREILSSGKSVSRLNGEIVTLAQLRSFCTDWVDIHGQYDNQHILNPENHIHIVDSFHRASLLPELDKLSSLYSDFKKAKKAYDDLIQEENTARRQKDFYSFEFNYISGLNLSAGEDDSLKEQLTLIKNSAAIYSAIINSYNLLYTGEGMGGSDASILTNLTKVNSELTSIASYGENISSLASQASEAFYSLEDIAESLRVLSNSLEYSDSDIDSIQERLAVIEDAKRKYHRDIDGILEYQAELEEKLSIIENFDFEKERLSGTVTAAYSALEAQASVVSEMRQTISSELEASIQGELLDLDFVNSDFKIGIERHDEIGPLGFDRVEFLISTNPGEPLMPLTKIASGGEISRIMLAFKHIIGESDRIETMIFDEIDTGISGRTALTVGKKMRELACHRQIVAITHLPQIAAYGSDNFLIAKEVFDDKSHTTIKHLDSSGKIRMVATLFSGSDDSSTAINAAEELIAKVSAQAQ